MKVICSNSNWSCSLSQIDKPKPKYMEECYVVDEVQAFGAIYYELAGYHPDSLFVSTHFVPASDILEKNIVNTKEECV